METDVVFSVIIPVYNMELYLGRCLDSVINQTYGNLEIIVINDGSTDRSLDIIKDYADRDTRIVVINKKNEGIGCAYIDALNIVTGDYVSFIDSDDYVDTDMYRVLSEHVARLNPDIIQFGYQKFDLHGQVIERVNFGKCHINGNYNIAKYRYYKIPHPSIGLKIMKADLFNDVSLLRQSIGIDVLISFQLFNKAESMLILENEFYHIFVREDSVSRMRYTDSSIEELRSYLNSMLALVDRVKSEILLYSILAAILDAYVVITNYFKSTNQTLKFKDLHKEYSLFFKTNRYSISRCRVKTSFKAVMFRYMPGVYFSIFSHKIRR